MQREVSLLLGRTELPLEISGYVCFPMCDVRKRILYHPRILMRAANEGDCPIHFREIHYQAIQKLKLFNLSGDHLFTCMIHKLQVLSVFTEAEAYRLLPYIAMRTFHYLKAVMLTMDK